MDEFHTNTLRDLVARFQAGETSTLNTLIRRTEEGWRNSPTACSGSSPGFGPGNRPRTSFKTR